MKPLLLLDGGMQRARFGSLQPNRYADEGILKIARKEGFKLERLLLVERPVISRKEARELVEERKGVILGGAGMVHPTDDGEKLGFRFPKGRITSGMINTTALTIIEECCRQGVPLLGICYGHQMIARSAGERIVELPGYEFGFATVRVTDAGRQSPLFAGLPAEMQVAEYHFLGLESPARVEVLATNGVCAQAIKLPGHRIYGVQFHPDFHWDADGKGTGTLQYYYEMDKLEKVLGKRNDIEPKDTVGAYTLNSRPLLNFVQMCEGRD